MPSNQAELQKASAVPTPSLSNTVHLLAYVLVLGKSYGQQATSISHSGIQIQPTFCRNTPPATALHKPNQPALNYKKICNGFTGKIIHLEN